MLFKIIRVIYVLAEKKLLVFGNLRWYANDSFIGILNSRRKFKETSKGGQIKGLTG